MSKSPRSNLDTGKSGSSIAASNLFYGKVVNLGPFRWLFKNIMTWLALRYAYTQIDEDQRAEKRLSTTHVSGAVLG